MAWEAWFAVPLLGSLGALTRFSLDRLVSARSSRGLPVGTLAVNLSGALALGLVTGLALSGDALVLAGSATIGSYTTFSTWVFETERLGEAGQLGAAVLNAVLSIVVGIAAVALGRTLGAAL